jgi:hypothetical protein
MGDEYVEERLELVARLRLVGLGGEPTLERLLKPLDLPARRRVVRPGVLLLDPEATQLGLEGVSPALAAREASSEDHPIVRQRRRRNPMSCHGLAEGGEDDRSGDSLMRGD